MYRTGKILQVSEPIAELGECPLWDPRTQTLFWLDIKSRKLFRFDVTSKVVAAIDLPMRVSAIGLARPLGLICVGEYGYAFLDPDTGTLNRVHDGLRPGRFEISNDGKCDSHGRFWSGTKDAMGGLLHGALYRLDRNRSVTRVASGFGNVNGIDWSPDNQFMYVTDTRRGTIYRYEFDIESGELGLRVKFISVPAQRGRPDGLAVDADGFLWSALWDGACVMRYTADGRVAAPFNLPVARPTSCAFGGASADQLFITTARPDTPRGRTQSWPGALFCIPGQAHGQPARWFSTE